MPDITPVKAGTGSAKIAVIKDIPTKVTSEEAMKSFSTEQLPELDASEGYQSTVEEIKGKEAVKEAVKEEVKEEVKEVAAEVKEEGKLIEEKPAEEKKEDTSAMRFLKPPKGSKEEKAAVEKKGEQFDLSSYTGEEQAVLKKMAKENVPFVTNLIKQVKELSKGKDVQFFQHENGYVLHPAFQEGQNYIALADREAREWAKALNDVKSGKPVKFPTGWSKDGKPIYSAEITDADPRYAQLEEDLRASYNDCLQKKLLKEGEMRNLVGNWSKIAQDDLSAIKTEREARFAWVKDAKLQEYTLPCEDGTEKPIKQIRSDFISLLPAYMRSSPATEVAADLMVALVIAKAENNELKKGGGAAKVKEVEKELIEPSGDVKPKKVSGGVNGSPKTFSMAGAPGIEI